MLIKCLYVYYCLKSFRRLADINIYEYKPGLDNLHVLWPLSLTLNQLHSVALPILDNILEARGF